MNKQVNKGRVNVKHMQNGKRTKANNHNYDINCLSSVLIK